jgi:hypothetical protein
MKQKDWRWYLGKEGWLMLLDEMNMTAYFN